MLESPQSKKKNKTKGKGKTENGLAEDQNAKVRGRWGNRTAQGYLGKKDLPKAVWGYEDWKTMRIKWSQKTPGRKKLQKKKNLAEQLKHFSLPGKEAGFGGRMRKEKAEGVKHRTDNALRMLF